MKPTRDIAVPPEYYSFSNYNWCTFWKEKIFWIERQGKKQIHPSCILASAAVSVPWREELY